MYLTRSFFGIEIPSLICRLSDFFFSKRALRNEIRARAALAHSPDGRILYLTLQFSSSDLDGGSFVSTLSRAFLSTPAYLSSFVSQVTSSFAECMGLGQNARQRLLRNKLLVGSVEHKT